ncbi:hypothetical protein LX36DRAFT_220653 [Colletotrichum falcatum]|nr:hypothetical protein LX36DRAFT_220653 [Colletotrichum falcatum]
MRRKSAWKIIISLCHWGLGGALHRNGIARPVFIFPHLGTSHHCQQLFPCCSLFTNTPFLPRHIARVSPRYLKWKKFAHVVLSIIICSDNIRNRVGRPILTQA